MRIFPKHAWIIVLGLMLVMAVSTCGGTTSSGSTPTTSAPTTAATPITTSTFTVQTAQATVSGKTSTILTNEQGLTLYYFTPDTASKTVCTGSCAQTWPPLLFTGTGTPTASTALPGA